LSAKAKGATIVKIKAGVYQTLFHPAVVYPVVEGAKVCREFGPWSLY
jgi:hypothetical protein